MIREELEKLLEKLREEVKPIIKDIRTHRLSEVNFSIVTSVEGCKIEVKVTIRDMAQEMFERWVEKTVSKLLGEPEWVRGAKEKWGGKNV